METTKMNEHMLKLSGDAFIFLLVLLLGYLGQSLIKYGLRAVGPISLTSPSEILSFFLGCASSWRVVSGAFVVAAGFALWVAFLSRMDISQALPLLACSYVPWLFIGYFFFDEPIGAYRVAGVILITVGVCLVYQSGAARSSSEKSGAAAAAVR
jgi:drug/metabolite transporter (DMT)-like permease